MAENAGMIGVDAMPDDAKSAINQTHDFQLGVLFARADATDKRLVVMDRQIVDLGLKIDGVNDNVNQSETRVVGKVQAMLTAQTAELKPLFDEKTIDDGIKQRQTESLQRSTNAWQRAGAIIGILFGLWGIYETVQSHKTPQSITVTTPQGTVVKGTGP